MTVGLYYEALETTCNKKNTILYVQGSRNVILYVQDSILYVQDSRIAILYVQGSWNAILYVQDSIFFIACRFQSFVLYSRVSQSTKNWTPGY